MLNAPQPIDPKVQGNSIFERFFVIQEGVISVQVRSLTVVSCLAITGGLLAMLYVSCDIIPIVECDLWSMPPQLPMVSAVIGYPIFDRIFCLMTGYYCFGVHQVNLRCFYRLIHGATDSCINDFLLYLGLVSTVALPAIGYFDMYWYNDLHGPIAAVFFTTVVIYAFMLHSELQSQEKKFDAEVKEIIYALGYVKWVMLAVFLTFGISMLLYGSKFWLSPLSEWILVVVYVNFFCLVSYSHNFYQTVHPTGKLVSN